MSPTQQGIFKGNFTGGEIAWIAQYVAKSILGIRQLLYNFMNTLKERMWCNIANGTVRDTPLKKVAEKTSGNLNFRDAF